MKITAIQCNICGDIVWSRAEYDFRSCTCESVAIDGGISPHKFIGSTGDCKMIELELDISIAEAYNDWNKRIDKLGIIHTSESTEFVGKL